MPVYRVLGAPVVVLSKIGDIELDLVESIQISEPTLVTENPVEAGFNINDHVVNLPVEIVLRGRFVDGPFTGAAGLQFFNPAQAAASAVASGLGANRSVKMWQELERLRLDRERVKVKVQQRTYKNMVIRRLSSPRQVGDGGSLRFEVEMKQIIIVSARASVTGSFDPDVDHTASEPDDRGIQAPSPF